MVKTLLVIGGGGYIGSTVTFNALTTTDMNVIVFDKLMYGGSSLFQFFSLEKRFEFVYGDVRMGIPKWTAFLKEHAVDFVFNAAALVGELIQENNAALLEKMAAMVADAAARPAAAAPRRLSSSPAARRSLGASGSAVWVESDDAKITMGVNADTDLGRNGAGRLATSGVFQLGQGADGLCAAAEDAGTST